MKRAYLVRCSREPGRHVAGVLDLPDGTRVRTLELDWRRNERGVSCIPPAPGQVRAYTVVPDGTGDHQWYRILDVPSRDDVEWHPGNRIRDTRGCPLPGLRTGVLIEHTQDGARGEWAVLASRKAMKKIRAVMGDDPWELVISWGFEV